MVRMQYKMSHHTGKVLTNFWISIFAEYSDLLFFITDGVLLFLMSSQMDGNSSLKPAVVA